MKVLTSIFAIATAVSAAATTPTSSAVPVSLRCALHPTSAVPWTHPCAVAPMCSVLLTCPAPLLGSLGSLGVVCSAA
ncbi:unnamed protein product [Aureobasidium vineae]|uniref:Uncharacterized protein n=1 Tax=Aureobasidium vineae TaxID=2773715 RepID=A0A9N8P632_9PEZI|nr:unnamed protein product [Aureobasidium vineae]